jgi:phosphate uptake regulator
VTGDKRNAPHMRSTPRTCRRRAKACGGNERIGDHATNAGETVFYIIEGQQIMNNRPKRDMTTFATLVPGN